jgi:hypothetical protein
VLGGTVAHNFSRNSGVDFAQYISERPELTPKGFGAKEGQNQKKKIKTHE